MAMQSVTIDDTRWSRSCPFSLGCNGIDQRLFTGYGRSAATAGTRGRTSRSRRPSCCHPSSSCSGWSAHSPPAAASAKVDGPSALARGDAEAAVKAFSETLADTSLSNDRRATLLNDRAVAYGKLGQVKLAVDDFNAAAQLFPEYAAIYSNRGSLLLSLGLPKEALKDFDRAIVLAPGYAAAFNNRAGAHVKLTQYQDAVRDYTRAVELMPQSPAPLAEPRACAFVDDAPARSHPRFLARGVA